MNKVLQILEETGAIIPDGHFVGTSMRHLPSYVNKDALLPHTELVSEIGKMFAEKFKDKEIDVVLSPAVAGIAFSQWTAYHLSKINKKEVLSLFTEKTAENEQVFKRGYDKLVKNKKVLIVEDTTTLGSSVKKVIDCVNRAGGEVVEVCVMVNRDPVAVNSETMGVPFSSLAVYETPSYEAENCPLCKNKVPVNTVLGHGKKFLESKSA